MLAGLVLSAHLMGFMWLVGTAAYIKLAERLSRGRWLLPILSLLTILTAHFYVAHFYRTFNFVGWHVYHLLGFDQFVLYGYRYRVLAMVMLLLTILIARQDAIGRWQSSEFWRMVRTPLELSGPGSLLHGHVVGGCHPAKVPDGFHLRRGPFYLGRGSSGLLHPGEYAAASMVCSEPWDLCFRLFCLDVPGHGTPTQNGSAGGGVGERASAGDTRDPKDTYAQGIQSRRCSYRGPGLYRAVLRLCELRAGSLLIQDSRQARQCACDNLLREYRGDAAGDIHGSSRGFAACGNLSVRPEGPEQVVRSRFGCGGDERPVGASACPDRNRS